MEIVKRDQNLKNFLRIRKRVAQNLANIDGVSNFCVKKCSLAIKLENLEIPNSSPCQKDTNARHLGNRCIGFSKLTRALVEALSNKLSLLLPRYVNTSSILRSKTHFTPIV